MSDIDENKRIVVERHEAAPRLGLGGRDHRGHLTAEDRHVLASTVPEHAAGTPRRRHGAGVRVGR